MVAKGFALDLITRSKKKEYPEDKNFPCKIYRIKNLPLKSLNYFRYFLKLLKIGRGSDLIFAQGPVSSGYPSYLANKFLRKKLVLKIVGDYAWEQYYVQSSNLEVRNSKLDSEIMDVLNFQDKKVSGKIGFLRKIQKRVSQAADRIIIPSRFLAKMVKKWGIEEGKISVIYNGTDFKPINLAKEEARKKIGISGNIILSVSRLVPWKGFKMLIKIMPQIIKEFNFARLVIVGDGPEKEILETMKNNLGLQSKVYLVGGKSQEELKIFLASADMFILNTAYEGFSHQLLEAMISGVPVITTNVGGNPELIKQGENGFMVKYNDELNLFEAIKALFNYQEIREKFIEKGRRTAEKFSISKMVSETLEVFNELISN